MQQLAEYIGNFLAITLLLFFGVGVILLITLYIADKTQSRHAIRRNYPIVGRFRYFFEHMGEFFRQYFFAMDREELPFNRALRSWIYRASKNIQLNTAFGSTRNIDATGAIYFANSPYPLLEEEFKTPPTQDLIIGASFCKQPYHAPSIFNISGMSYGALSKVAVEALSRGAATANCWLNTGEGGLSEYHQKGDCDIVFQIGTAKYGVRNENGALCFDKLRQLAKQANIKMFELKLSQGAKPGKGGVLPGSKVNQEIAATRGIPKGVSSLSPNRHKDISNDIELLQMIHQIRGATQKPVGIKFVLGDPSWLDKLFAAIDRLGLEYAPDFITLDSADGGTGAAPQALMDFVGMRLKDSLPALVAKRKKHGLEQRIKIIASGKLVTPSHVAWALSSGADFTVSARGFMFALGCIQALQCNKNSCPTGITTHDEKLQRGLDINHKSERVANYHSNLVETVDMIAHSCGAPHALALKPEHVRIVASTSGTSSA